MTPTAEHFSAWPAEQKLLCDLLASAPGGFVIEVGAYQGATSRVLGEACQLARKELVCVDPWDNSQDGSGEEAFNAFLLNVRRLPVVYRRQRSQDFDVTPYVGKCALVFIDGDHSYEGCKGDIEKFEKCCAPGGWIAVHDIFDEGWSSVKLAVGAHTAERGIVPKVFAYDPTPEEVARYGHGVSGVAYWRPNLPK